MFFQHKQSKPRKLILIGYIFAISIGVSSAYASKEESSFPSLTEKDLTVIAQQVDKNKGFHVVITPEVLDEVNQLRASGDIRAYLLHSLKRMKDYQPMIEAGLQKNNLPHDLLNMPLIQSGYQPLDQNKNPVLAAGMWQLTPAIAKRFGLTVSLEHDDRLNAQLSTKAALAYLKILYNQFHDWNLAVLAYEIGEEKTGKLIQQVGSHDAWDLARSPVADKFLEGDDLKGYLALYSALLLIMQNPLLITE